MVNDKMLKEKALEIATVTNLTNFKAINGYLDMFKGRNQVIFTKMHGEANSVDQDVINYWHLTTLKNHIHLVGPVNIYNGDELGPFWRMQSCSTYSLKDSLCKFGSSRRNA